MPAEVWGRSMPPAHVAGALVFPTTLHEHSGSEWSFGFRVLILGFVSVFFFFCFSLSLSLPKGKKQGT